MTINTLSRRDVLKVFAALGLLPSWAMAAKSMHTRQIPASAEAIPIIGLGTYQVFDVAGTTEELALRRQIVEYMVEKGASVVDTSPMYNRAEKIIGDVVTATGTRSELFLATKVWTDGQAAGARQMQDSATLMQADVLDLVQVHNLRDLDTHMATIRDWQEAGRVRYNGITDYRASALDEMALAMKAHKPDFIQINYSLGEREADERVLPMAADMGIAVLTNRPYLTGRLFSAVRDLQLPDWASPFATSWGQFFLKYIVSHPAVTCAIPATSKLHHLVDNLGAGFGVLPDQATRVQMERLMDDL